MIIGISGPAGSGKSTAAQHLVERHGFTLVKFAAPLKAMLYAIGLTHDEIEGSLKQEPCDILCGQTPRHAMQTLGTEWGRDCIGESFWTDLWEREAARYERVVCDDCRFDNELEVIHQRGGIVVGLTGRGGIAGNHASETGVRCDEMIDNSGSQEKLYGALDILVSRV